MNTLKGTQINLRPLEPEDLDFVYQIENDESLWHLSNSITPFSLFTIREYLKNAHKDIFEVKQLRLLIEDKTSTPLGLIDLFDFDFKNKRAGVGIIIKDEKNRSKGYGKEALDLLLKYSFKYLGLHQIYCNILEDNLSSVKLFESLGFEKVGLKKDWNYNDGEFQNELLYQLIR